jgi:hypothetical protein
MNLELLRKHVADGVVNTQRHPKLPLDIYNYSARCQYEKLWDDVTLACRGLVLHGDTIVARPFRKFFNDTELGDAVPWHLPSVITEKMDGSLGILFHFAGAWHWSTRGSFTSEQAGEANRIMEEQYDWVSLDPSITYLFEIIYPENRIVVDYRGTRDLVLLGMIVTATGEELPLDCAPGGLRVVRNLRVERAGPESLRSLIRDEDEGYVVRFDDGTRVKVKGQRYIDLHRMLSGISSRAIWEELSAGRSVADLLAAVPDECAEWIEEERQQLVLEFNRALGYASEAVLEVRRMETRKEQAKAILANWKDVSGIAFAMLDGRDPAPLVWKAIYPERRTPALTARLEP